MEIGARRVWRLSALLCVVAATLFAAPAAMAASEIVNITRFSKIVSGVTGGANNTVTVSLLRNTIDPDTGLHTRVQVDQFVATADGSGIWSGSFTNHDFATSHDEIEIKYSGGSGAPAGPLTLGSTYDSQPLLADETAPARFVDMDPTQVLDDHIGIASDGSSVSVDGSCPSTCTTYTVSHAGLSVTEPASGTTVFPQSPALTNNDAVTVTGTFTADGATINFTDNAPMLSVVGADQTAPATNFSYQPSCTYYTVTMEVGCGHLAPGSYILTQMRGATSVATQTLSLAARNVTASEQPAAVASTPFTGVQPGDQFVLKPNGSAHTLTTLTVAPLVIHYSSQFNDGLNDNAETVTGTCGTGLPFNDSYGVCRNGTVPANNHFEPGSLEYYAYNYGAIGGPELVGQFDETSSGATEVDLPEVVYTSPLAKQGIHDPFLAVAEVRYDDPAALILAENNQPEIGHPIAFTSTASSDAVALAVAPEGSSTFTSVGNANVPGGIPLPALNPGNYVARWTLTDTVGDTYSYDTLFSKEPAQTIPTPPADNDPAPPSGPGAAVCKASSSGGLHATVASARRHANKTKTKPKKPKRPKVVTVTLSCASASGSRVAVWLARGGTIVGDGSAVSNHGNARIPIAGPFVKGTYALTSVVDASGRATEATQVLTLR